jgi:tetratricopeptide (TPR) repeat protein
VLWEIQQDPWNERLDGELQRVAASAIASADAWTKREPTSGEAWFYLAAAHAPLSQWRVFRGERLAAARDGKRIKEALERALELDPTLQDAWFGIGLYHYYAGVAPAALKLLRILLLLPGGDRREGLAEMNRARAGGQLLRGEADYQLHWIYVWYEEQPGRARDLIRSLDDHYPTNPLFLQRLADIEHVHFSDHAASAAAWQQLRDRAATGRVSFPALADTRAQVGLAAEWIDLGTPARAIEPLRALIRTRPSSPHGVLALASITLGDAYMALNSRADAATAYADALRNVPSSDPEGLRTRARSGISRARSRR